MNRAIDDLPFVSPPVFQDHVGADGSRYIKFNYVGDPVEAPWGQLAKIERAQISFGKDGHFLTYGVLEDEGEFSASAEALIPGSHLLLISTTNSAHALSEVNSFVNFYRQTGSDAVVYYNSYLSRHLTHIIGVLRLLLPEGRLVELASDGVYQATGLWARRNTHMNLTPNYTDIPYALDGDVLTFDALQGITETFLDDPAVLAEAARAASERLGDKAPRHDKIMMIKTRSEKGITTPERGMSLSPELKVEIEGRGIKVFAISDFTSTEEYLATLYNCNYFVTSYGGPACTNRFFCNPDARVVVMANLQYKFEYEYPCDAGPYWHIRHSHLFPVSRQTFLLDHNDEITGEDVERLVALTSN